jgi:hypothetical protein
MATPAGYIDAVDDAWWLIGDGLTPTSANMIIPVFCPPQYDEWRTTDENTRQEITLNLNFKASRVTTNYSIVSFFVSFSGFESTDTAFNLDFDYDENTQLDNFEDIEHAPDDHKVFKKGIFGPDDEDPATRMEYRDIKIRMKNGTWDASDTEKEHILSGVHIGLEHNDAFAGPDYELIGSDGAWHIYDEQRPISAYQMKYLLCENQNNISWWSTPNFSMPLIGEAAVSPP